ncbi:hypothetical protein C8R46DRAFT_1201556 [Mycena filopes]|nr:hypothetical protein C8R46DRAFT_1201556 [Mycena filopes]
MFAPASDLSPNEIRAYRKFAFPEALGKPGHDPFFSVDVAATWISSFGYQLYLEHDDSVTPTTLWNPGNSAVKALTGYQSYILADAYLTHPFFSLENLENWISGVAFQAYMDTIYGKHRGRRNESSPLSSRAPSRAASAAESRPGSRMSFVPSSRASSPMSYPASDFPSRPSSSMSVDYTVDIQNDESLDVSSPTIAIPSDSSLLPTQLEYINAPELKITRQHPVDRVTMCTVVPSTFVVPRDSAAYLVDLSDSVELLTTSTGKILPLDAFIRAENQESWKGSGGHAKGDVNVSGFDRDFEVQFKCRRLHLTCNGVNTCEFIDPALFADCERFEPDEQAMQELWNHELDANELEASSAPRILSRFYNRIQTSKCKIKCDGVPILVPLSHPSAYGKRFFVGCSKWSRAEMYLHVYWPMPPNINEANLRHVMEHDGRLPGEPATVNNTCILTVHPRVGLKKCPYSHIINGQIRPANIVPRICPTIMNILVPNDHEASPATAYRAIVIMRNAHNHPMHPTTKPRAADKIKLRTAIAAAGLTGLTVQRLQNAQSTSMLYDGERIGENSPAFVNSRKVRDFINGQKKIEHPRGMGWDGVLHWMNSVEVKLPKHERFVHTAMSKNGFKLVVTMHPQIAMFIHKLLSLVIDFTFKRVEGEIDEWEVAGFLERFHHRITFASLYCDKATTEAFSQLFTEFFDTIKQITGETLKLAPFYPDAKCRVVILDGEAPQALGFADFLASYNNPEISNIWTRNPIKLLSVSLKTCNPHFGRHIEEMPPEVPRSVVTRMKSIMGLETQEEVDSWHAFCVAQTHDLVKNWYAHKLANPWVLPSVNKFLSKISPDDWDITPNHSNYVETAHAARNAETSIGVPLLTAILQAKARDDVKAAELAQVGRDGVMRNRWNGNGGREKLSAQRQKWRMRKTATSALLGIQNTNRRYERVYE